MSRGGGLEVALPGREANDLPWGSKGFPGEPEIERSYTD